MSKRKSNNILNIPQNAQDPNNENIKNLYYSNNNNGNIGPTPYKKPNMNTTIVLKRKVTTLTNNNKKLRAENNKLKHANKKLKIENNKLNNASNSNNPLRNSFIANIRRRKQNRPSNIPQNAQDPYNNFL